MSRPARSILAAAILSICACGVEPGPEQGSNLFTLLPAGKRAFVQIPVQPSMTADTLQSGAVSSVTLSMPSCSAVLAASLIQGAGTTPASRIQALEAGGASGPVLLRGVYGGGDFDAVGYSDGDSTRVERLWDRGSGEVLVLTASASGVDPEVLCLQCQEIMGRAVPVGWVGSRSITLPDRAREDIEADLERQDVTPPPPILHRMVIRLHPAEQAFSVTDSFTIDFSGTRDLDSLRLVLPNFDSSAQELIAAVTGTCVRETDSILCRPPDSARIFEGVYETSFVSFRSEREGCVNGQARLNTSFCCDMWFYPGSPHPSAYEVTAFVPRGDTFYCPLDPVGDAVTDSSSVFVYESPDGGISRPLPWVAGKFDAASAAGGRSAVLLMQELPDSVADASLSRADLLCTILLDRFGFEGGRLDVAVAPSISMPVLASGPGCLVVSPDMLALLDGAALWDDSLAAGFRPRGPRVAAKGAGALLALSTHLPVEVYASLSIYAATTFAGETASEADALGLLENCRLYYLSSTSGLESVEYSIADPMLPASGLYESVTAGKAPVVWDLFHRTIPGFDQGLSRALGSLRHSGNVFRRIESAAGIAGDPALSDYYWTWLMSPGVPQIVVSWADSAGRLAFGLEQLQPGREFPLRLFTAEMLLENGTSVRRTIYGPEGDGRYWCSLSGIEHAVSAIDVTPDLCLPADIIYERIR